MNEGTVSKLMGIWFLVMGIILLLTGIGMLWMLLPIQAAVGSMAALLPAFGTIGMILSYAMLFTIILIVLGILAIIIAVGLFTVK